MLLSILLLLVSPAAADDGCAPITLRDLRDLPSPGVLVLGESPGYASQLRRAARVVRALRDRGEPVTLAIEVLPETAGGPIEQLRGPDPDLDRAERDLRWSEHSDLPFAAYRPLLALGLTTVPRAVTLRPVGPPEDLQPTGTPDLSTALLRRIEDLAGPTLPLQARHRVAAARATADARIAETALAGWGGEGVLILVVDRGRVAGRGGLPSQLKKRTEAPVWAATLDWRDHDCLDGLWQWSEPTLRLSLPALFRQERRDEGPES